MASTQHNARSRRSDRKFVAACTHGGFSQRSQSLAIAQTFTPQEEIEASEEERERASAQSMRYLRRWLEKSTCLVIGPGLGNDPIMQRTVTDCIRFGREKGLPMVLDADALTIVARDPDLVRGYHRAVLTPNVPELWRLADALDVAHDNTQPWESPGARGRGGGEGGRARGSEPR